VGEVALATLAATTGAGLVGYKRNASTRARTVEEMFATLTLDVREFGDYSATDNQPTIQAAVDHCLNNATGRSEILVPKGGWKIQSPIIIAKKNAGNTAYDFATAVSIRGENPVIADLSSECRIIADFDDGPAFVIQVGRAIEIANLVISGQNNFSLSLQDMLEDDDGSAFILSGVRDNRYSPHCGIAIDPFSDDAAVTGGNSGNQYPGLSSWYIGSGGGSGGILIERCVFRGFACGVAVSPGRGMANGEDLVLDRCRFETNCVAVGIGQPQTRGMTLRDCYNASAQYYVCCTKYGERAGAAPVIVGGDVIVTKYLFGIASDWGGAQVLGLYAENFLSLGHFVAGVSNKPNYFSGCTFNFQLSDPVIDYHAFCSAPMLFAGCTFGTYNYPLSFVVGGDNNYSQATFQACSFFVSTGDFPCLSFNFPHRVAFDECTLVEHSSSVVSPLSRRLYAATAAALNRMTVAPGAIIELGTGERLLVSSVKPSVFLAPTGAGITVDGLGGGTYAMATPDDSKLLQAGDLLINDSSLPLETLPNGNAVANKAYWGRVVSVYTGAYPNVVTCEHVTKSSLTGTDGALDLTWIPRFHEPTIGTVTNGSMAITNVDHPTAWGVGDRIRGAGIVEGAYITGISGSTITMSINATETNAATRLYDADYTVLPKTDVFGNLSLAGPGAHGQALAIQTLEELTTIAAAANTDTTIQIPAGAIVLAVSVRVTVAIPTAATFDVGVAGATTRYGTGIAVAANTTNAGTATPLQYAAAAAIRITPDLTPGAATGKVRVTIHYIAVSAPTS
jgi:hypothetical protein